MSGDAGSLDVDGWPLPRWMRLRAQAVRLSDDDLGRLGEAINLEQRRRRRRRPARPAVERPTIPADSVRATPHAADRMDWQRRPDPARRPRPAPRPRLAHDIAQLHIERSRTPFPDQ